MTDELYYDAIDLLKELIATPRISRREHDAALVVERWLAARGCEPVRVANNVWVSDPHYSADRPTLLLNSHIDTVKPVEGWTRDPFSPDSGDDGRIYGLGSTDAGASLVSLATVFVALLHQPRSYNLVLAASAEEEVSGRDGLEALIPRLPHVDVAIVGEPTAMQPAVAQKGLLVLDGVVTGVAGHAARSEGVNAIYRAIGVVDRLRSFVTPVQSAVLGPVKVTVTGIEAGTQHNVVPDRCSIVVDVRTTDAYSNTATLHMLRRAVPECTLTPRSTRLEPSSIPASHPLVERAVMLGLEPFGSPTLSDSALMPWPALKIGPGDSARSHRPDEYIHPDELRHGMAIYMRLLQGLKL